MHDSEKERRYDNSKDEKEKKKKKIVEKTAKIFWDLRCFVEISTGGCQFDKIERKKEMVNICLTKISWLDRGI